MSTRNTLANSTAPLAPTSAKGSVAETILATLGTEAVKANEAQRTAGALLARGILGWLAAQSDERRAEIFIAIEAKMSQADCRKIAIHSLRPQIDPARVEAQRSKVAEALNRQRTEKQQSAENAKRQRDEAKRLRQQQKEDAKRAQFEALRAELGYDRFPADRGSTDSSDAE
ncbi:MAG: hypothetical protein Q4G49_02420 [Paracoccus sp. (in: a-proteobacteria)]|nr:hypothetical protein [Paracoccus sp. (in: a-proteobacteria)]